MSCTMHTLASSSVSGTPTAAPAKEEKNELFSYEVLNFKLGHYGQSISNIFVCFIIF